MSSENYVLGMYSALYYGSPGETEPTSMTEVDNVMDLDCDMSAGETDITTRGNGGFRATAPTLKEGNVTFQMLYLPGDEFFEAVRTAWKNSTTVALACLTEDAAESTAEGPVGDFCVTGFKVGQPLEDAVKVDVTMKVSRYDHWHPDAL